MLKLRTILVLSLTLTLAVMVAPSALAKGQPFHHLYYDGEVVRTIVPPAAAPKDGIDPIFPVVDGVEGQLPVAGVAPGDTDYHGGKWAVNVVTWNVTPYLLISAADVWAAAQAGDVTVTRMPELDFKCPIQP